MKRLAALVAQLRRPTTLRDNGVPHVRRVQGLAWFVAAGALVVAYLSLMAAMI